MAFQNVYEDEIRARAYAQLAFPGTYYLAFRDIPELLRRRASGGRALDFGCGAGRSSRFLAQHGFRVTGVDISAQMIARARELDPSGDFRLVQDGRYQELGDGAFDVVLAAFTFDNIPGAAHRAAILDGLRRRLSPDGIIVLLGSTPEIYTHEWASFSTAEFEGNRVAGSGDVVFTRMKDVDDARPVQDILWLHEDYLALFRAAGLCPLETLRPLALPSEPFDWISETEVAPWVIYCLRPDARAS